MLCVCLISSFVPTNRTNVQITVLAVSCRQVSTVAAPFKMLSAALTMHTVALRGTLATQTPVHARKIALLFQYSSVLIYDKKLLATKS